MYVAQVASLKRVVGLFLRAWGCCLLLKLTASFQQQGVLIPVLGVFSVETNEEGEVEYGTILDYMFELLAHLDREQKVMELQKRMSMEL